jgi:methionyl-tRNA formyltransferase
VRLVFAGTPEVAVPSLEALLGSHHDVVAVLTRPDAPRGRGRRPAPAPVAVRAAEAGVEVLRPARLADEGVLARLRELEPDCCPVVAFGALVPPAALAVPAHGWVNLHFSLLPAWRGAAPVQHALLHGDDVTGATTFLLERGLDTGPVLGVLTETVRPRDTGGELLERLSVAGAGLLLGTLDGLERGDLSPVPQPAEGVSHAPKLTVDDARVSWDTPAFHVDRLVRACTPAPGAWTTLGPDRLGLGPVRPVGRTGPDGPGAPPGTVRVERRRVLVGCGDGTDVELGEVRPQGRRTMPAADWARGVAGLDGRRLG